MISDSECRHLKRSVSATGRPPRKNQDRDSLPSLIRDIRFFATQPALLIVGRFAGASSRNATQCDKANSQAGRKFFSRGPMHIARVTVTISTRQTTFALQDQSAKERKNA